jgi:adenine-specific DNA methylase
MKVDGCFDLVYIDTPYIKRNGAGVDYHSFYHFLDGMLMYRDWHSFLDRRFKHLPLRRPEAQPWSRADQILEAYSHLFDRFRKSILCVSYRSDGFPSISQIAALLGQFDKKVRTVTLRDYRYALSTQGQVREILLIAAD